MSDLHGTEHAADFLHVAAGRFDEVGIAGAQEGVAGLLQQPPWQAAHFPFGARIRAGTQDDPQAFLLRELAEFGGVALALPVEAAFAPLVVVPEQIGADCVQAHGLDGFQAVLPVLARHAGEVHFAAADLQALAVQQEVGIADGEARGSLCRQGQHQAADAASGGCCGCAAQHAAAGYGFDGH